VWRLHHWCWIARRCSFVSIDADAVRKLQLEAFPDLVRFSLALRACHHLPCRACLQESAFDMTKLTAAQSVYSSAASMATAHEPRLNLGNELAVSHVAFRALNVWRRDKESGADDSKGWRFASAGALNCALSAVWESVRICEQHSSYLRATARRTLSTDELQTAASVTAVSRADFPAPVSAGASAGAFAFSHFPSSLGDGFGSAFGRSSSAFGQQQQQRGFGSGSSSAGDSSNQFVLGRRGLAMSPPPGLGLGRSRPAAVQQQQQQQQQQQRSFLLGRTLTSPVISKHVQVGAARVRWRQSLCVVYRRF
jgi:hypothetical protein